MKFWKKKEKSKNSSSNPFDNDNNSFTTEYSQTSTIIEPSYKSTTQDNQQRNYSRDRQNLFDGVSEQRTPNINSYEKVIDEDPEVGQIRQKIRNVKQDSLASTRNALQKIGESEAAANSTMGMLGTQSSQLANAERSIDISKAYTDRASSQAGELKKLNRSIFIPAISNPFTKSSKNKEALEKLNREHAEHTNERNEIRKAEYDTVARMEHAQRLGRPREDFEHRGRSKSDKNRYQFEADEEDDAIEDEIDHNLDLLSDATSRLRVMAGTMNDELNSQNKRLDKLNRKVDPISAKLASTTHILDSTK